MKTLIHVFLLSTLSLEMSWATDNFQTSDKKLNLKDYIGHPPPAVAPIPVPSKRTERVPSPRLKTVIFTSEIPGQNWDYPDLTSKLKIALGSPACGKTDIVGSDVCPMSPEGCRIEIRSERCKLVRIHEKCETSNPNMGFNKRFTPFDPHLNRYHICQQSISNSGGTGPSAPTNRGAQ
jgi:hypothetical protein